MPEVPTVPSTHAQHRSSRISLRVTSEQKDLILQAAELEASADLTRFVTEAAVAAAKAVTHEHGITNLAERDRKRLYELLLDPPKPSASLIALLAADVPAGFSIDD